jgi:hypothetical protein
MTTARPSWGNQVLLAHGDGGSECKKPWILQDAAWRDVYLILGAKIWRITAHDSNLIAQSPVPDPSFPTFCLIPGELLPAEFHIQVEEPGQERPVMVGEWRLQHSD